jgi:16S rRNA (cytosine967-C5)-methyltransferase
MSGGDSKSARAIAAEVLQRFDPAHAYAGPILESLLDRTQERQRATDLVYGTIRNLHAIDAVISEFSGRLPNRISSVLLSIIRVAVYELVYNPATPVYSIVNEAVTDAGRAGGKKQTGFVNAVLRQVARHISDRQAGLSASDARRTLVQTPETGCVFDSDFLPDPATAEAAYLVECFSLPPWLVTYWLDEYGPQQTRSICLACNRRPSLYVRVNPLRTTAEGLLERFAQAGIRAERVVSGGVVRAESLGNDSSCRGRPARDSRAGRPRHGAAKMAATQPGGGWEPPDNASRRPQMIRITGPHAVTQLPGFAEGLFTVQDLSASQAVRALEPQPGWSILDMCSAPGTKTTQLAEATRDSACITATDIDPKRLERVQENVTRLGFKSVTIVREGQIGPETAGSFDAVLLDVPCSNTGVFARRVEARFRIRPNIIEQLAVTQRDLLARATSLVRAGGRICYSTCSIQEAENQGLVRDFLARNGQCQLVREERILPSAQRFDHDGAYVALLMKK